MKWVFIILVIEGTLISCRKGGCGPGMGPNVQGTYVGTFVRNQVKAVPVLSVGNVKITFSGNEFNGSSDSLNYPFICNGTFTVTDMPDSIHFVNKCVFPANFDWTMILNGSYKLVQTGDSLYIRRTIGDFIYEEDVYSLRKQ
jgi:hypothetical protein